MRHDSKDLVDWVIVGVIALSLLAFFAFVQHANNSITGNVVGTAYNFSQSCYSFTDDTLPVVITQSSIDLCPTTIHHVDYFELRHPTVIIRCHGSTIMGTGGALFISKTSQQPRVTLEECVLKNIGGYYLNQTPVDVRIK
ncbi:MAG: hypothetical protein AABX02_00510 [archaeon]